MTELTCPIVLDLLPLHVDGVLRPETDQAVWAHLDTCPDCRREHDLLARALTLPAAPQLQQESGRVLKGLRRQLTIKRVVNAAAAAGVAALVVASAFLLYLNVAPVHDFFSPVEMVSCVSEPSLVWEPLSVGEDGHLNFDKLFYRKKVTLDANSEGSVTLRFTDPEGNVALDRLTLHPGTGADLGQLARNTDYTVELQSEGGALLLRFY